MPGAHRRNVRILCGWAMFIVLFNAGLFAYLLLRLPDTVTVDNVAQFLGPLLAVPLCGAWWRRSDREHGGRRSALVRAFIALSAALFAAGQIIWAWYELVLKQSTPFPSYADLFFMLSYPCLMAAILLVPQRGLSFAGRARVALDGAMVVAGLITLSWYFILGPTVMQGGESSLARVVGTIYPVWDVVLLACVLVMVPALGRGRNLLAGSTLAVGLVVMVVADGAFDYGTLQQTYATGNLADVGWPLAYMLMCLGAGMLRLPLRETGANEEALSPASGGTRLWAALLPYALIPPVVILFIYVVNVAQNDALRTGVEVGSACLLGLLLVRQVVALLENNHLSGRLRANNAELEDANRQLQALATTDPHTGLPNHRAIVAALRNEMERASRYGRPCSLLFVDLDHFKKVNDGLGHAAGDVVLNQMAMVLHAGLRGIDFLGRWGGEEFVALLPETGPDEAADVGERLRAAVARHVFTVGDGVSLTCSIGMASYPSDADSGDSLVDLADQAMYVAKRLGRNQMRSSAEPAVRLAAMTKTDDERDESELLAVIGALHAVAEARGQHAGMAALDELRRHVGNQLDPQIVDALQRVLLADVTSEERRAG